MITWVLYLCIGIIIGGMAGFYFAKLDDFSKKQKKELEEKLQKSERELLDYKDEVTAHFRETAELINNMTESYQKVHEHLAQGSVELCNNAIEVNKLTISSNQLLSSTSHHGKSEHASDADKATSLTESEAPKNISANNNDKSENNDAVTTDSAESKVSNITESAVKPENQESLAPSLASTLAPNTPSSASAKSDEPSKSSTATPEKETDQPQSPVLETMAVAEEESAENSEQEDSAKSRLPGSRMVH